MRENTPKENFFIFYWLESWGITKQDTKGIQYTSEDSICKDLVSDINTIVKINSFVTTKLKANLIKYARTLTLIAKLEKTNPRY